GGQGGRNAIGGSSGPLRRGRGGRGGRHAAPRSPAGADPGVQDRPSGRPPRPGPPADRRGNPRAEAIDRPGRGVEPGSPRGGEVMNLGTDELVPILARTTGLLTLSVLALRALPGAFRPASPALWRLACALALLQGVLIVRFAVPVPWA